MSNVTYLSNNVLAKMDSWRKEYYQDAMRYLAEQCTCDTKYISCVEVDPRIRPGYDAGYVFFGPKDIMIAEIRWNRNGKCSNFLVYEDKIDDIRERLAIRRAERARAKSVNRSAEQAKKREQPFKKGMEELLYAVKRNIKEVVAIGAFVAIMTTSVFSMHEILHPDYINDSYKSGYQAVSLETFRTNDNTGFWYDYSDIAERFDAETMDFDSYVYGTYSNVGWNQESRIDCMNSIFRYFKLLGVTDYSSFLQYCDSKGVCKEEDGKLVIDTTEFCSVMEEYMESLNNVNEFQEDKSMNRM